MIERVFVVCGFFLFRGEVSGLFLNGINQLFRKGVHDAC